MKVTRANVSEYAQAHGLHENNVDGIPEGFGFVSDDIKIGNDWHGGDFIAFVPLSEWGESQSQVKARTIDGLQVLYKEAEKVWQARK